MQAISAALGVLIKILGGLLAALVCFGVIALAVLMWSDASKQQASYECVVRRMDHHIAETSTATYHDTCMAASGYLQSVTCSFSYTVANGAWCYYPRWMFWRK